MRVRAVLLDMDGTLVDSDAAVERAWEQWSREYDVPMAEIRPTMHGAPAAYTVRRVLPAPARDDAAAVRAAARRQLVIQYDDLGGVRAAVGAGELLGVLDRRQLPWAVVTSADRRLAGVRLDAAGITPPVLVTVEDVHAGKPDPEGYLLAARLVGVEPAACLVVEDAAPGVEAGRAAGMRVAGLRGVDADVPVADLAELARLLDAGDL